MNNTVCCPFHTVTDPLLCVWDFSKCTAVNKAEIPVAANFFPVGGQYHGVC